MAPFFPSFLAAAAGGAQIFGVRLVGVNAQNGKKLLFSVIFIVVLTGLTKLLSFVMRKLLTGREGKRVTFWSRQAIHLATVALLIVGLISIWFDDPSRLTTAAGLVTA